MGKSVGRRAGSIERGAKSFGLWSGDILNPDTTDDRGPKNDGGNPNINYNPDNCLRITIKWA